MMPAKRYIVRLSLAERQQLNPTRQDRKSRCLQTATGTDIIECRCQPRRAGIEE